MRKHAHRVGDRQARVADRSERLFPWTCCPGRGDNAKTAAGRRPTETTLNQTTTAPDRSPARQQAADDRSTVSAMRPANARWRVRGVRSRTKKASSAMRMKARSSTGIPGQTDGAGFQRHADPCRSRQIAFQRDEAVAKRHPRRTALRARSRAIACDRSAA